MFPIFAAYNIEMDKVEYWVDISDYDYDTAEVMYKTGRYLYVGFCCHQAIEKILKAYYFLKLQETALYTHNLTFLAKKTDIYEQMSKEQKSFIIHLEPLNIETRYPAYKDELAKKLTKEKCKEILIETNEFREWIKEKLSKN